MEPLTLSNIGQELDGVLRDFLENSNAPRDLLKLFTEGMEYQINFDLSDVENGPKYNIRNPKELDDGALKFYNFKLNFDLPKYIQAFGLNGIDRIAGVARWVGFDFDGPSHADNSCTVEEINEIAAAAASVPWVTVRHSTRGDGLHLYVMLDPPIPVASRAEHKQLSSAILSLMSQEAKYTFDRVDTCGGILWFWSTKLLIPGNVNGLTLKSQGEYLDASGIEWKGFKAPNRSKRRLRPPEVETAGNNVVNEYDLLTDSNPWVDRDEEHNRLIKYLEETGRYHKWYHNEGMLRTHTLHLKAAHTDLKLKGVFETNSPGTDLNIPNTFAYPCANGVWRIIRYFAQASEHFSWSKTSKGWPTCYLNRDADIPTIIKLNGGILTNPDKQIYLFNSLQDAMNAAQQLGKPLDNIPQTWFSENRRLSMTVTAQNDIIVDVDKYRNDTTAVPNWALDKKSYRRVLQPEGLSEFKSDLPDYDDQIRSLMGENANNIGWAARRADNSWGYEPSENITSILQFANCKPRDIAGVKGLAVHQKWTLVHEPFQPEYPGNRRWNRDGARLLFEPKTEGPFDFPNWQRVLNHLGEGLTDSVESNEWCQVNGILSGADYLAHWIANMIRFPYKQLPYLFFYSHTQNNGKTTLHAGLRRLMTDKAVAIANQALTAPMFNGELLGAVLCVVEEDNITEIASRRAKSRIKQWTTDKTISIRQMYLDAYSIRNATHWIQCANELDACPIDETDTRVTVIEVPELTYRIPSDMLLEALESEGPDFVGYLNTLNLATYDRLGLPAIRTIAKAQAIELNKTNMDLFIEEVICPCDGNMLSLQELYDEYLSWAKVNDIKTPNGKWDLSKTLKTRIAWGNLSITNQIRFLNVSINPATPPREKFTTHQNGSAVGIFQGDKRISETDWQAQLKRQ